MTTLLRLIAVGLIAVVAGFLFGVVSMGAVMVAAFVAAAVTPGLYILASTTRTASHASVRRTGHGW